MSAHSDDPARPEPADDLLILVPRGARPTADAIAQVARNAPWLDHAGPELGGTAGGTIALQRAGLGFDLAGLAPGVPLPVPLPVPHPLSACELPDDFAPASIAAVSLRLGPHIEAGQSCDPARVVRACRRAGRFAGRIGHRLDPGRPCTRPRASGPQPAGLDRARRAARDATRQLQPHARRGGAE